MSYNPFDNYPNTYCAIYLDHSGNLTFLHILGIDEFIEWDNTVPKDIELVKSLVINKFNPSDKNIIVTTLKHFRESYALYFKEKFDLKERPLFICQKDGNLIFDSDERLNEIVNVMETDGSLSIIVKGIHNLSEDDALIYTYVSDCDTMMREIRAYEYGEDSNVITIDINFNII